MTGEGARSILMMARSWHYCRNPVPHYVLYICRVGGRYLGPAHFRPMQGLASILWPAHEGWVRGTIQLAPMKGCAWMLGSLRTR